MDLYTRIIGAVNEGVSLALNESFQNRQTLDMLKNQFGNKLQWFLKLYSRIWRNQDQAGRAGLCFDQFVQDEDYVLIKLPVNVDQNVSFDPDDLTTYKNRFVSSWPIAYKLEDTVRRVLRERWGRYITAMKNSGIPFVKSVAERAQWYCGYPMTNLRPYYDMLEAYILRRQKEKRQEMADEDGADLAYQVLSGKFIMSAAERKARQKEEAFKKFCKFYGKLSPAFVQMLPVVWLYDYILVLTPEGVAKCSDKSRESNTRYVFNNTDEWERVPVSGEHRQLFYDFVRLTDNIAQAKDFLEHASPYDRDIPQAEKYIAVNTPVANKLKGIIRKIIQNKKEDRRDMQEARDYLRSLEKLSDRQKRMLAYLDKKLK